MQLQDKSLLSRKAASDLRGLLRPRPLRSVNPPHTEGKATAENPNTILVENLIVFLS